jgi:hypothetical protein
MLLLNEAMSRWKFWDPSAANSSLEAKRVVIPHGIVLRVCERIGSARQSDWVALYISPDDWVVIPEVVV